MTMIINTFNTGREYSVGGQVISYTHHNGHIYFLDHTRACEGVIKARRPEYPKFELEEIIMYCYDRSLGDSFIDDREIRQALRDAKPDEV